MLIKNIKRIIRGIINRVKRLNPWKPKPHIPFDKNILKEIITKPNPIIFEIGCADGGDTADFLKLFPDASARFYAFEPEPKNIKLVKNISDSRLSLFEGAVADTSGEMTFNRSRTDNPQDPSYSGSIMSPKNHLKEWNWIYFDETMKVRTITLDTFTHEKNIDIIDFVWCDVQGAEEKVIKGGKDTLEKKVRFLYTEYSNKEYYKDQPTLKKILKLLPNFEIVKDYGSDVLLKNKNIV